jgi:hypothetical protein
MKRNYALIALVACIALVTLAATPGHAQVLLKADVPFSFSAGYGTLPAGEYSIARAGFGQVIQLSAGRRGVELMMPHSVEARSDIQTAKLVFHRYGDEYFLAEIWTNADDCVRKLVVNRRERQMAKAGISPEVAVVYGLLVSAKGN